MTRLAVLADIHGNLPALEAVIADMAGETFDQVIVAGDLINIGPFSREVLETVFDHGWVAVRGNHEHYLLNQANRCAPEKRHDWPFLDFVAQELGDAWQARLAVMPDELTLRFVDAPPLRVLHGAPGNPLRAVTRISDEAEVRGLLAGVDERCVVSGHYHMAFERRVGDWHVINPGPVGTPHDGQGGACYAILEGDAAGWRVEHRRVPVDYEPLYAEMQRLEYVERFGLQGLVTVEQFRCARPLFVSFWHWMREQQPGREWSLELLNDFLSGDQLWHSLPPEYRFNRHLLTAAPIDRESPYGVD